MWSRDMSRDQKLKIKEMGELVGNLLCLDKHVGISESDKHTKLPTFGTNVRKVQN